MAFPKLRDGADLRRVRNIGKDFPEKPLDREGPAGRVPVVDVADAPARGWEEREMIETTRQTKARERKERAARIEAAQAETRAIVATGVCPCCGSALRRNLSITGWWQCEQLGADTHRANPAKPACRWQGFTE